MKIFELSWNDYESSTSYLFTHNNKTEEEFNKNVDSLILNNSKEYLEQEESWASADELIRFISYKLLELGYERVNTINRSFYHGFIMGEYDKRWKNTLGEDNFNCFLEHNKKIEKRHESI